MNDLLARLEAAVARHAYPDAMPSWRVPGRLAYVVDSALPFCKDDSATRSHGLARALAEQGHSVVAITRPGRPWDLPGFDAQAFAPRHDIDGVRYLHLPMPPAPGSTLAQWLDAAADALKDALRVFKPSAVMASADWENALPAAMAAREMGLPFFYELHGLKELARASQEPAWQGGEEYQRCVAMETAVARVADRVFVPDGVLHAELVRRGVDASRIALAPSAYRQWHKAVGAIAASRELAGPAPLTRPGDAQSQPRLRVACIFDEFTYHSFSPECELLQLRSDRCLEQMEAFRPDFLFIESVWRGADDTWVNKISDGSNELRQLIQWCNDKKTPVAFWCKEDPVHFERFLPVAALVDHVFTTDIDCIPRYKHALQHERVHLLAFAAQPRLHNPIEKTSRLDAFCFAGSYYSHYPDRQVDFKTLASVARKLKYLDIYDRNADRPQPHAFNFPEEFHGEIKGKLPYAEMDKAYKGYRYGVTVNTIKQSQTMFARRAFELMACNTIVVSNYSRGLRLFFGELVAASDDAVELERKLQTLCTNDLEYRQHRLRGLRKVLSQHTYEHRLAYVAAKALGQAVQTRQSRVCMVAEPRSMEEAHRLVAAFFRQNYPAATLGLVMAQAEGLPCSESVRIFGSRPALLAWMALHDHVAPVVADDYYGADYLSDLVLATKYCDADAIITKGACFVANADGSLRLAQEGSQYRSVESAALRGSLLSAAVAMEILADPKILMDSRVAARPGSIAVDEFSYCRDAFAAATEFEGARVDVPAASHPGADHADIIEAAQAIAIPVREAEPVVLKAADWFALMPKQLDKSLKAKLLEDGSLRLSSTLEEKTHKYVYFNRRLAPAEIAGQKDAVFHFEGKLGLGASAVFVFQDDNDKKISHVMCGVEVKRALRVPPGTASIKFGLRIEGPGEALLGTMTIGNIPEMPAQPMPAARHLLLTNQYPSYNDLYRYAFVHARVRAYMRMGVNVDVLRLTLSPQHQGKDTRVVLANTRAVFREFQGVDVVESTPAYLENCLAEGKYESVLIHIMDQRMWEIVRKHLDHVKIVVWAHGSEIQPWWRRAMNFPTDAERDKVRKTSDARMAMWGEILRLKHPNLRLVFVSRKQAMEVMSDLGLRADQASGIEIISNYINSDLFKYSRKAPELRKKILSIRPFASTVYGNDLTVKAIQLLRNEPFFEELSFKIVGDGELFEQTVAPLQGLKNVEVTRAFLTQDEIAALHKQYGVFLVPSRMDSQGVSRDEAMASGLVPVTNRVAAIPEFVNEQCGFLAEPEDAEGLAQAIRQLYKQPKLFQTLSEAAARRVRSQSSHAMTIERELELLRGTSSGAGGWEAVSGGERAKVRVALYGDVNLNIMDGSAIWASSLAETLAGIENVRVSLLLKARIQRTQILARLLDLAPAVQLIEPKLPVKVGLTPAEAVGELVALDHAYGFRSFILRGLDLCTHAAANETLKGRIWAYLTDIPQRVEELDDKTRTRIASIVAGSEYILCQTPQMEAYFIEVFPQARGKTRILSPMIPVQTGPAGGAGRGGAFRLCYAGKFAPRWGILEMLDAFQGLHKELPSAELHVFGDKIHNPPEMPGYHSTVKSRLQNTEGLSWHGAVDRDELMRRLGDMHACWAFRDPVFERETLELSTKALEYAALGMPTIMARSPVNESVFGSDYGLFADSFEEATQLLQRLARDADFKTTIVKKLQKIAARYTFPAVRASLVEQGILGMAGERLHAQAPSVASGEHPGVYAAA